MIPQNVRIVTLRMFVELSKHINLDDEKHAPPTALCTRHTQVYRMRKKRRWLLMLTAKFESRWHV